MQFNVVLQTLDAFASQEAECAFRHPEDKNGDFSKCVREDLHKGRKALFS